VDDETARAVAVLESRLGNPDERVRGATAVALGAVLRAPERALDVIEPMLRDVEEEK